MISESVGPESESLSHLTRSAGLQLRKDLQQGFPVDQVFVAVLRFGLEQALDVERVDVHAVHVQRAHMRLERFVGFAVRRKQQVDEQIVGNADILGLIGSARSEERRVGKECRSRWSPY